jgi:hypothetical protein
VSQHIYERRYTCRACCESDLRPGLDLGTQPLANALLSAEDLAKPELRVPLNMVVCPRCGLAQLTHVVDPDVLYGPHYPYRSGTSQGWRDHCWDLANEAGFRQAAVLDIGCLDGVLLQAFKQKGAFITGCDPSMPADVPGKRELFGSDTRFNTRFDLITATNVFGHVDDARGFLEGVKANLVQDGTAIIECPWIVDLVDRRAWDTIYHEHLSYWGLHAMARIAGRAGLYVSRVRHFPHLHGGTMRYYLGHKEQIQTFDSSFCPVWWAEEDLGAESWEQFRNEQHNTVQAWTRYFAYAGNKQIAAFGAAAKFSTLLNSLPERPPILAVFDDTPSKQGRFTPGWHLPILAPTELALSGIDELVIGAPNWKDEIEQRARSLGFRGDVVSPW